MVAVLRQHGIAFFGVPKCAGTSIYHTLYGAVFGVPYPLKAMDIHYVFPTLPVDDEQFRACQDLWKFTVVRDPVERLISAFSNRIRDLHDLDAVYRLDELDRLSLDLSERLGQEVVLHRENKSKSRRSRVEVPLSVKKKLLSMTEPDYALLADYYQPPEQDWLNE